ncbi:hypothetical protein E2C01_092327 [Portunus trituberculatus]|uniref:Uncharacterized protein n=1 Tax=Portunus trituberculatus TaxID=210409 RepID=A0A5B7JQ99_PORTR|nr:hypothetical protein [Portunus trituberculatus]
MHRRFNFPLHNYTSAPRIPMKTSRILYSTISFIALSFTTTSFIAVSFTHCSILHHPILTTAYPRCLITSVP